MTEKLKRHLIRCEKSMQSAKPILGEFIFPVDKRTLTVIGFISWLIELQESILLLVMHDKAGSAFALFRPVVEGACRALWINFPATDAEVKKFNEKDKIDLGFGDIVTKLDNIYSTEALLQGFKDHVWKSLNSYTHGGMRQIGQRFVKNEVANNYSEEDIMGMTAWVTSIVLLTISVFLKRQGHADSGDQIQRLFVDVDS